MTSTSSVLSTGPAALRQAVALLAVSLQELVHQLLTQSVQLPFQVAFAHLLGVAR